MSAGWNQGGARLNLRGQVLYLGRVEGRSDKSGRRPDRPLSLRNAVASSLLLILASCISSCSFLPWWARVNVEGGRNNTAASRIIDKETKQDGMFIGVAISGGGSRAANFGAAVMFELAEVGLLQKADVISSVSGGSIAAAYYALHGVRGISFDRLEVDQLFARDFQLRWVGRWFDPRNIVRYWATAFDRSDIMYQVFEANLFHEATFAELSTHLQPPPKFLINTTNFVNGRKFVFSNQAFDRLDSDLATYPVARAVMASGAFPLAFANVTLQDYHRTQRVKRPQYVHLFDGGPIDNLGVGTIVKALQTHLQDYLGDHPEEVTDPLKESGFPKGCLIIAIDAYTERVKPDRRKGEIGRADLADTRPWYGFLVDTNAIEAANDLLAVRRNELLHELGVDRENDDVLGSFPIFALDLDDEDPDDQPRPALQFREQVKSRQAADRKVLEPQALDTALKRAGYCHVWHIGIAQMPRGTSCPLGRRINKIGTWYSIKKIDQCGLFETARKLVQTMWSDLDLERWVRDGLPTSEPIRGAPLKMRHRFAPADCKEPGPVVKDGREVCEITVSATSPRRPALLPQGQAARR